MFYSPHLEKTSITVDNADLKVIHTSSPSPKRSSQMSSRTSQSCPRLGGLEDRAWLDSGGHAEVFGLSLPFLYPSSPTGLDLPWLVGGQSSTVVPFLDKYSSNWVGGGFSLCYCYRFSDRVRGRCSTPQMIRGPRRTSEKLCAFFLRIISTFWRIFQRVVNTLWSPLNNLPQGCHDLRHPLT